MALMGTATGVVGVGYQGRVLADLVDELVSGGVDRLVDVRLTPISRKPGFSKRSLCDALRGAGIQYEHHPELGNPKPNRAGFAGDDREVAQARSTFLEWISRPEAAEAIDELAARAAHERVAVLCFEADQGRCHRDVVLAELADRCAQRSG
jgi:uncharacterized protein (DUF488 family)